MSALLPFNSDEFSIRVLDINGEPWFIALEIAEILGYSDSQAMTRRLDDDEKSNRQIVGLGSPTGGRGTTTINEAGLYSAILASTKPEAKPFKRWVTHEVLPAIRKTGSFTTSQSRAAIAANDNIVIAETISRALHLEGSAHLGLMRRAVEKFAPAHVDLLPSYAIDAPSGSGVSSEPTAALTELLVAHGVRKSAQAVNKLLEQAGLLETLERKSSKSDVMRQFKSVTVAGQRFGKNVVSDRNPLETQPHWYRSEFGALLVEVRLDEKAA
jgi:prophage antirepressor-like protein